MNITAVESAGFTHSDDLKAAHVEQADKNGMHETGPYVVQGVWQKGLVSILVEQNTAAEPMGGGMNAIIQHPAVAIVSGPKGKAACNPEDTELLLALADSLS